MRSVAELRRLAGTNTPGTTLGTDARAGAAARELFVELRGVVHRSVRVDARRWPALAGSERRG